MLYYTSNAGVNELYRQIFVGAKVISLVWSSFLHPVYAQSPPLTPHPISSDREQPILAVLFDDR